jgi:DNA-binding MarR family transcriptional regulator
VGAPDEPRWLDDDEMLTWLTFVSALSRLPSALDAQLQREADISHFEYLVLAGLSMSPESTLRMSELAQFTESSLSRLSNVVARMEKRGWVTRSTDPEDGRYTLARLTDPGWDKVTSSAPAHVAEVRRLVFDPLSRTQQRQLRRIGEVILHAIDPTAASDGRIAAVLAARRRQGAGADSDERST